MLPKKKLEPVQHFKMFVPCSSGRGPNHRTVADTCTYLSSNGHKKRVFKQLKYKNTKNKQNVQYILQIRILRFAHFLL